MSKKKGFIKWYRDATDNPLFCKKPFDDWHAFEYLCLKARKTPTEIVLDNGVIITIDVGQVFISREKLADVFGWSVKKLRAWENRIKRLNMGTAKGTQKGTLYTLKNYEFHQCEGQAKGQAKGQPEGTSEGTRKRIDKECIKNARACEGETPRDAEERKVIPMPEEIKTKWKDFMEG